MKMLKNVVLLIVLIHWLFSCDFLSSLGTKEIYDEHSIRSWRCYLTNTRDVIQKILLIPENADQYQRFYLKIFRNGADKLNPDDKNTYQAVVKVDEKIVKIFENGVSNKLDWKLIPVDNALIKGKEKITISIFLTGKADASSNYVNLFGEESTITTKSKRSMFNGQMQDLSPENGQQRGEYLIRLAMKRR
jgi:hypothetical protein